jgi:hypothetical protein
VNRAVKNGYRPPIKLAASTKVRITFVYKKFLGKVKMKVFFEKDWYMADEVPYVIFLERFIGKFLEIALWLRISRVSQPEKIPKI